MSWLWHSIFGSGFKPISTKMSISVHPLTQYPSQAWQSMRSSQKVMLLDPLPLDLPIKPDHVRFVCISDTHSRTSRMTFNIPDGDVLLHGGDFTTFGDEKEVLGFNKFLGSLPHTHKVVIAGNHELSFDPNAMHAFGRSTADAAMRVDIATRNKQHLTNATFLEDSSTEIYGIKIYGTPWQPEFGGWAYNLPRGHPCLAKWNLIPSDTDILISHGPPLGHGDLSKYGTQAGCVELLATIQNRVKPKFHVFGHIHEGYGVTSDGTTTYINCCICDVNYQACNAPIIFDIPLPDGHSKTS